MSTLLLQTNESKNSLIEEAYAALPDLNEQDAIEMVECIEELESERDPLYWLQFCTQTENPKHEQQGLQFRAPFPQKSYFNILFAAFQKYTRLFIPKTRDMLTSWCAMGWAAHQAQWKGWDVIVQTDAEKKAAELVKYISILYTNQAPHLKVRHPLKRDPGVYEVNWRSGGRVMSIPHGADKIRMYHPTLYVIDEAAFLPEVEDCYNAAMPVATQIIAISSAGPGWFGDICSP